jgi:hypothetical protein
MNELPLMPSKGSFSPQSDNSDNLVSLPLMPKKKDVMASSGKSPFMVTKKDEDGFWGALSDTFDIGLQRMGAAAISGGATFLTKVLTGAIKSAVGEEDFRWKQAINPLIDTLEAPSEWLLQKANEFNEKSAPKLNEAAIKMGLKEENLDVPANELLRKDVGQGFLKLGIASVTQLPQLISTVLAGESKLPQFLVSASLATTQSIQEEYDKDKNVSGTDIAQSGLKGIVEGLTEMIFDTDLKTIRKTGAALVDITYDGATSAIKNLIKSEGKKEAKEAIIRTWGGVVKEGLKGMGQEALEEGISSAAGFVIDTIDSGKLDGKDYEKLKDDFYDSMLIGGFMGGGISSIGAMASKQKLTKEQEHQVSKLQEVANDESLPTEAREVAASKIEDIKKYNFGLANDNYKLLANLPVDQRVEALNLTNRIENFEIAKSKSKTENLIAEFDLRIEDLEKKRDAIFNEYDASGAKAAAEAKKTQSDKDQEIANQFIDTNNIFGEVDNSLAPIQQRLNNNEQIDENELNKSADELYTIADRIHKDETLTPEQKNIILAPIEEQIQKLDTYELATKTTTTEITQTATTKGTREVGRVERQGGAKDVSNNRWAGIPVSVTSEDGTVTNTIAEVTPSGKVILKPKTSFNKKSQIRDAQTEVAKKPLVIDTNFTEFVESKFDEDGNVSGVVLKDNRNNTTFEVNDPVLALDIAIKEKQNKLGTVSDAIFEQVLSETPVGTKILQETKLAGRKAIPAPQVTAQTQVTSTANILGKLTPRQAVEVDSNIEQRTDNPILNTLGAQVKTVVSNAFKALKSVSPDSRMVIYDNEDSMIEGLVNEGVSREDAINSALGAGGLYNPSTGNIHINKGAKDASGNIVNTLTGGTIPHEITHAVLSKLAKENPAEFTEMINRILPFIPEPQRSKLQEFAGRYEQEGGDIQAEEFLAELASMITKGTVKFKTGHIHRIKLAIKDFIKKIADKYKSKSLANFADNLFKNETSAQSDMKFFEDLARSIQSGQKINTARIDALLKENKSVRTVAQVTPSIILKAQKADVTKTPVAGNRLFNEPLADAKRIATEYMDKKGLKYEEGERITSVDKERAKRMSDAYMEMADDYNIPEVKASYDAMIDETIDQYKEIISNGYEVEINDTEPYKNAQEFIDDLRNNKHFKLLSTLSEFGDTPVTEEMANNDPRLKRTEFKDVNGQTLLANDLFRFVHDFFGHAVRGNSLGAIGEENAWDEHSRMYTPLARKAMTSETRGQNSYVNFSGVNDNAFKLRDIARKLRAEGRIEDANKLVNKVYEMMQFAPQKLGLLPDEFVLRDDEIKPTLRQQKLEKSKEIAKKTEDKTVSGFKQPSMILIGKVNKQEVTLYSGEASVNDLKEVKPIMYINRAKTLFDSHLVSKKTKDIPQKASKQEVMTWADKIYKEAKNNVISNLLFIYDNIPSNIRDISKLWYDGANIIAQKFSEKYNLSLEQTSAVIATQSPQKPWFDNVHLAHYVIDFYSNNQDSLFTQEAYDYYKKKSIKDDGEPYVAQVAYLPTLQKSIGKKFSELNEYDKSGMIRYSFDNFADRKAPLRIPTGIIVSKVNETSSFSGYDTIAKAVSIIEDGSEQNISDKLGKAFKVRNFYNNIVTPQTDNEVTIDTHAIAASYLLPLGSKSKEVKFDEATYAFFADAYREAAKQRGVLAREMQSITWEGARSIFPSEEKTDTNKTESRGIWQTYKSGKTTIEEAQQKIKENGKDLSETDWGQYINQLSKEGSDSDYIGELPVVSGVQQTVESRGAGRGVSGVSRVGDGGRKNGLKEQKVPNATAASKKAFEQKRKFDISKFPRDLQKWLLDRQVNIRKVLRDAEMEFTMYALVNKAGATPLANYKFQGIYKAIYDGMTKEEIDRLDDFIFLRRVIAIDSNFDNQRDQLNKKIRDLVGLKKIAETKEELQQLDEEIKALHEKVKEKKRPDHPEHLDSNGNSIQTNKESAEKTLANYKQILGEETYNKMYDKSNQYFNAFTDLLKYKFDNGLITKEEYDMYKDYNYSPRKFFNHVFGNTDANIYTIRGISLNQDEIKGIQDGSLDYLETNSMKLLHSAMVATENKVMTNKALRTFFQEAAGKNLPFFKELNYERRKDGSIVTNKDGSLAYKGASAGFTNMIFKVDGINQGFQLDSELAKEFLDVEKWNSNHKAYKLLSNASGAQVLRQMATGLNVGFFISNIPIDLLSQIHFNDIYNGGGVGVAGQYQKAISGTLSTVKSLIANDPEIQKLVLEYAQAGGLMMTQSQEGTSQAAVLGKVENALSYLGNISEMASKLNAYKSVKERETAKYAEENNGAKPDAAAQEKINARAAFEARGAMDFHRGGLLTKYLDGFIPYLNVAFQGARITADYIYKNPVKFTNKIIQTGLGVMALTLYNMMVAGDEWDNDDLQQAKAGKLLIFSPFKNADGTHSYTEIPVPTGVKAFWNLFQNMGEGIYYKHIVNKPEKLNGALAKTLADDLAMMMPKVTTMMPPTFKAIYEYSNNKNLWTNRNITYEVVKTKDEGKFDEKVLGIYKIMGKVMDAMGMDLSPIKTQKAVEDVITNPHTDIAIGLAYSMLDKFVNLIPDKFGGLSEKEKSKYSKQTIGDFAVQPIADLLSRATGTTDKKNNGKYLNIQEIIDKENKEVGSYRQEIKYDVQKMAEDKVPMKDALNYITSIGNVGDKKFAANYYKALTEQSYLSIPSNKFRYGAIAFGATTDEARAKVLYASFPNFNVIENDEVMKDLKLMGIATPMTMMYYKEIYANKGVLKNRL